MVDIKQLDDWLDKAQLICTKTDGKTKYNFSNFTFPLKFASKIYNKDFTLQEVEDDQQKLNILINKLNNDYNPVNKMKIKDKNWYFKVSKKLLYIRKEIIRAFKEVIFPYIDGFKVEKESDEKESDKELDENELFLNIKVESNDISYELFKEHFNFVAPTVLEKTLLETKDKKKNNNLVNVIKSELRDLKDEIEKMCENEKEIEKQNKIVKIVEDILTSDKKFQSGEGLKILTPD